MVKEVNKVMKPLLGQPPKLIQLTSQDFLATLSVYLFHYTTQYY